MSDLTEERVASYLDGAINRWREIRDSEDHEHKAIAHYYIDAFQSVRVSLLGEGLA